MANRHLYLGIENLNLNASQRNTLVDELKALGPASSPHPPYLMAPRVRLDNQAVILEALFDEGQLTVARFKQRLGTIFVVDPDTIDHATMIRHFGGGDTPVVTFSRGGTDYLRFALFGDLGATWEQSGNECRAYLAANIAEWEEPLEEDEALRAPFAVEEVEAEAKVTEPAPPLRDTVASWLRRLLVGRD